MSPGWQTVPVLSPPRSALEELLLALSEHSPDGLLVVSPDGRMAFMNRRFAEVWRLSAEVIASGDDNVALAAALEVVADPEGFMRRVRETYADPRHPTHDELALRDGRVLDRYGAPLHDATGAYLGWAWYFRDVTELRQAEREQRSLAATLQASLLPPRPPSVPGMDVATRYRPADRRVDVGGDFFDVFRLGPNDWGLVVGDVCGKGARAASLTAATRYTLRAAAAHAFLPSAVLEEVNTSIAADATPDADDRFCAVAFARLELDVCGAWVTLACAGHPRPIVVRRAGWIDLRGQTGPPVGMFDRASWTDDRVGLGPGDALVFCTDGITEARDAAGEMFGDEALPALLVGCAGEPVEVIAERLVAAATAFSAGRVHDDIVVMVVRVPDEAKDRPMRRLVEATGLPEERLPLPGYPVGDGSGHGEEWHRRPAPPREARIRLAPEPESIPAARHFLSGLLRSWRMPELVGGELELLTSELATNATRHARSSFTVIVRYDGAAVRVEVGDGSRALPVVRTPAPEDVNGRGMVLVEALADRWGVVPTLEGKRVWIERDLPPVDTAP